MQNQTDIAVVFNSIQINMQILYKKESYAASYLSYPILSCLAPLDSSLVLKNADCLKSTFLTFMEESNTLIEPW